MCTTNKCKKKKKMQHEKHKGCGRELSTSFTETTAPLVTNHLFVTIETHEQVYLSYNVPGYQPTCGGKLP